MQDAERKETPDRIVADFKAALLEAEATMRGRFAAIGFDKVKVHVSHSDIRYGATIRAVKAEAKDEAK
jgi:hypothetical protein